MVHTWQRHNLPSPSPHPSVHPCAPFHSLHPKRYPTSLYLPTLTISYSSAASPISFSYCIAFFKLASFSFLLLVLLSSFLKLASLSFFLLVLLSSPFPPHPPPSPLNFPLRPKWSCIHFCLDLLVLVQNAGLGEESVNKTPRTDNTRKRRMKGRYRVDMSKGRRLRE